MPESQRYNVKTGKYGMYFYDNVTEQDLPLVVVQELLNRGNDSSSRVSALETSDTNLRAELSKLEAEKQNLVSQRDALSEELDEVTEWCRRWMDRDHAQ